MTSAHSMQITRRTRLFVMTLTLLWLTPVLLAGCAARERLRKPATLTSPYDRPQVWAVAPFNNESGVSIVKTDRVADLFAEQVQDIDGVSMIPVNRVLLAMQKLQLRAVNSPGEAAALMNVLDVDGLIVGTVTAYDPYPPPKLGAAVQLFRRESRNTMARLDPIEISRATTDRTSPGAMQTNEPVAQAAGVFDATNHQTLLWLDQYAAGRVEPGSAYGKREYLVNMEMYTQFVAFRLLHDLLASEQARLQPQATQPQER